MSSKYDKAFLFDLILEYCATKYEVVLFKTTHNYYPGDLYDVLKKIFVL